MSGPATAPDPFIEEVLFHCIYALGCGAQMDIERDALIALLDKVRPGYTTALNAPGLTASDPQGEPRWDKVKSFLLRCSEAIGRLAAQKATAAGSFTIKENHLMDAYSVVRTGNAGGPGSFCPN